MARPTKEVAKKKTVDSPPKKTKRAKAEKDGPKRATSAYMIWLNENRTRLTKPGMKVTDVAKAAGVEWKALANKDKWQKLAEADKARYEKEKAAYQAKGDSN